MSAVFDRIADLAMPSLPGDDRESDAVRRTWVAAGVALWDAHVLHGREQRRIDHRGSGSRCGRPAHRRPTQPGGMRSEPSGAPREPSKIGAPESAWPRSNAGCGTSSTPRATPPGATASCTG